MREKHDVILGQHLHSVALKNTHSVSLSFESATGFGDQLARIRPDVLIHTAGMTSVDRCEQNANDALQANSELAKLVATATRAQGIKLVHISTDHLFSGSQTLVTEEVPPSPINTYGRTKQLAEQWVRQENPEALIVRTNFFGWGHVYRQSFSDWIIVSLRSNKKLTMFDDVFFTPILADSLAKACHGLVNLSESGIFNVVGHERVSKYEFGIQVANRFGLDSTLITPGKIAGSRLAALRPFDMSLDNHKVTERLNGSLGRVDDFLSELYEQEQLGRVEELKNAVSER